MEPIAETDLIINADGSVYHLNLLPGDIADTVITVGDPDRVGEVSKYFDVIELRKGKREFITHTGYVGSKRLTVLSTGIGTDNIDIVLNELDALVNVNLITRLINTDLKQLDIIRIGTSGALQADIPVDSLLVSSAAIGMDTSASFYRQDQSNCEIELLIAFSAVFTGNININPYMAGADAFLLNTLSAGIRHGITVTAPGFYAPQGRQVRALNTFQGFLGRIAGFKFDGQCISNLEMETAGIYNLANILNHRALSFNVILANRATNTFSKQPAKIIDGYIRQLIEKIGGSL